MDLGLHDKVAFIAGSSRGIGAAIARAFVSEGAKAVVTGRNPESLAQIRASLSAQVGSERVHAVQGDMTNPTDIRRAIQETIDAFGGIDAVVANVGNGSMRGGWDVTPNDWLMSLNINLMGSMALAGAALSYMTPRGSGSVTFVSSIAGCEAMNAPLTYSAAKAALQSAMKNLSRLVGQHGVRVNAVAPGNVLFPGGEWERKMTERREFFEQYIQLEVPLRRFGQPEEIADAVTFLASGRASFITGACLVVDGGQTRTV